MVKKSGTVKSKKETSSTRGRKPAESFITTENPLDKKENVDENKVPFQFHVHIPPEYTTNIGESESEDESDENMSDDGGIFNIERPHIEECRECENMKKRMLQLEKQLRSIQNKHYMPDGYRKASYSGIKMVNMDGEKMKIKTRTNVDCRYHRRPFKTMPHYLVDRVVNGVYYLRDNYCSISCALARNLYELKDDRVQERKRLTLDFYRTIFGIPDDVEYDVRAAPPLELLDLCGGTMTLDDFLRDSIIINKEYIVSYPPSTSVIPIVTEQSK